MDRETLREEFEEGPPRPARIQVLRDDIHEHTDLRVPRRRSEIEEWLEDHRDEIVEALE